MGDSKYFNDWGWASTLWVKNTSRSKYDGPDITYITDRMHKIKCHKIKADLLLLRQAKKLKTTMPEMLRTRRTCLAMKTCSIENWEIAKWNEVHNRWILVLLDLSRLLACKRRQKTSYAGVASLMAANILPQLNRFSIRDASSSSSARQHSIKKKLSCDCVVSRSAREPELGGILE